MLRERIRAIMKPRTILVVAVLAMLLGSSLPAQPPVASPGQAASPPAAPINLPAGPPSWDKVTGTIDAMIAERGLDGAFLEVARGDEVLYSRGFGRYTRDTVLNVASATKWVTATLLMTLVERNGVDLEGRIDRWLPWIPSDKAGLTLGQLLSHTSGLPGIRDNPIDLRQGVAVPLEDAARQIAALDLAHPPGTMFDYGGAAFQLSGAVAQAVTGKRWEELFQERLARPLGMTSSRYGHPAPELESATDVQNPNLQAGLFASAADYLRFLAMIDARGAGAGQQILTRDSIATMERTRIRGLDKRFVPPGGKPHFEYGLGLWCETVEDDGRCGVVSSPGSWGTYPWIDRGRGIRGLFVVKNRLPAVAPYIDAARSTIDAIVDGS
jgi:CubicO group peptidase (beta-lactamase class C family)